MFNCSTCRDSGLLAVYRRVGDPHVIPYQDGSDYEADHPSERCVVYRCNCEVGDRHPRGWPQWRGERPATVERHREFARAGDLAPEEQSDEWEDGRE